MIIGICGKSGSGKSTLSKAIIDKYPNQAIHVEIDKVGHYVLGLPQVQEQLVNTFGKNIINNDKVNRKRLGDIVFNSYQKMDKLTDITWKYMQIEIDNIVDNNKEKIIILDWLLLPKSKYLHMCDYKILIDIPYEVRLKRAMERDNITEEDFILREKATIEYQSDDFDYIIKSENIEKVRKMVNIL